MVAFANLWKLFLQWALAPHETSSFVSCHMLYPRPIWPAGAKVHPGLPSWRRTCYLVLCWRFYCGGTETKSSIGASMSPPHPLRATPSSILRRSFDLAFMPVRFALFFVPLLPLSHTTACTERRTNTRVWPVLRPVPVVPLRSDSCERLLRSL